MARAAVILLVLAIVLVVLAGCARPQEAPKLATFHVTAWGAPRSDQPTVSLLDTDVAKLPTPVANAIKEAAAVTLPSDRNLSDDEVRAMRTRSVNVTDAEVSQVLEILGGVAQRNPGAVMVFHGQAISTDMATP